MNIFSFLSSVFGTFSERQIKKLKPIVNEVNSIYTCLKNKSIKI